MLTLIISILVSLAVSLGLFFATTPNPFAFWWSLAVAILLIVGLNFLLGRVFLKKLTALFQSVEKDLRNDKSDRAIEKLKAGYPYAKWQFFVKEQINAQIGIILYARKKFDEARPYLEKGFSKNWMAMSMLAALYYKERNYADMKKTMDKAIAGAKKEGFLYSLYAWFLSEIGENDKAVDILQKGASKVPLDDKIEANLAALKNNKKIKMQNYGMLWMQLHLGKTPDGGKPYQQHLMRQRIKRR